MADEKTLTFVEHIEELRRCLLRSVIFTVIVSCIFYTLADKVLRYLIRPVGKVVFIAPHEAFMVYIKVALFGGLILSSPYIVYQIWHFVDSGLKENEKRYALIFGPVSFLLFLTGSAFGFFVIVPIGISFLMSFASDYLVPMITVERYVSFLGVLSLVFGIVFQLPLAMLLLTKLRFITPKLLTSRRKEAIVLIFIVAAILTPPDAVTQILLAIPLLVLYELGIILSKFAYRPSAEGPKEVKI